MAPPLSDRPGHDLSGGGVSWHPWGAEPEDGVREETGEVVMAGSGFWRYLHRRSWPSDSRVSGQAEVPPQSSCGIGKRRTNPYGVWDLLRRGHVLGPALTFPGLAAFDSGDAKRRGRRQGV